MKDIWLWVVIFLCIFMVALSVLVGRSRKAEEVEMICVEEILYVKKGDLYVTSWEGCFK